MATGSTNLWWVLELSSGQTVVVNGQTAWAEIAKTVDKDGVFISFINDWVPASAKFFNHKMVLDTVTWTRMNEQIRAAVVAGKAVDTSGTYQLGVLRGTKPSTPQGASARAKPPFSFFTGADGAEPAFNFAPKPDDGAKPFFGFNQNGKPTFSFADGATKGEQQPQNPECKNQ
ncbi:hypothetical protein BV25DRAFT_1917028 [Artomyces pyxidatus]|uniref:Uncharacterized protein n=1 Tax=Artomyces pyxidatus TaxID=48021 RepID=A0ACB8SXY1_9AGAM|nr:hypothetical protein BV25DRAFT_1917028 [Artomyces pyxidatus]